MQFSGVIFIGLVHQTFSSCWSRYASFDLTQVLNKRNTITLVNSL